MDAYVGEIRIFAGNYAPMGWMLCEGQILQVRKYDALFAVISNQYGGDGIGTFMLPDLRGRAVIGAGGGTNMTSRTGGKKNGAISPTFYNIASESQPLKNPTSHATQVAISPAVIGSDAGSGEYNDGDMPCFALTYIICVFGYFPVR